MLLPWIQVSFSLLGNASGETCPGEHAAAYPDPVCIVGPEHISALTASLQLSV